MKDIKEHIKKMGDNLEIPESLEPKNVEKLLVGRAPKRRRMGVLHRWGIAAVVVLFIVWIPFASYQNQKNNQSDTEDFASDDVDLEERATYQKLFDLFSYEVDREMDATNGVGDMEVAVSSESLATKAKGSKEARHSAEGSTEEYSKVNAQTDGVSEGDVIVTDGDYIYVVRKNLNRVQILKTEGEKVKEISDIRYEKDVYVSELYIENHRLILTGVKVNLDKQDNTGEESNYSLKESRLVDGGYREEKRETVLLIYDVSNSEKPEKMAEHIQSGEYETSRIKDGYLYTFSKYWVNMDKDTKKSNLEKYVPSVDGAVMEEHDINMPKLKRGSCYYIITSLKVDTPKEYVTKKAFVAADNPIFYVSGQNIYLAMGAEWFISYQDEDSFGKTSIVKYSYQNGKLEWKARNKIKGQLNNQFSLDEYEENLRAVVTYWKNNGVQYNAVYVLDKELRELGSIGELAKDENIYSARFQGNTGYFVTYRETDPLFSVDFSDPKNPEIIGKLKIPGFSNYLHFYGDGRLLGIGQEDGWLKLSMFDISNPKKVKELSKKIIKDKNSYRSYSEACENHKAVLIDEEKNMIGFPVDLVGDEEKSFYCVYSFKSGFNKKLQTMFKSDKRMWNYDYRAFLRGVYIGENLYIVNTNTGVKTFDLSSFKRKAEFRFSEVK